MSGSASGLLGLIALLGLMAIRVPVGLAMLLVGAGGYIALRGPDPFLAHLKTATYPTFADYSLSVIPLFLLMGEILFRSGSVEVLFDSVDRLVGRLRGRLYLVVIALSTIFGALSGSAVKATSTDRSPIGIQE